MIIALATDHAGFEQLKELRKFLEEQGHECLDFGPKKFDPDDDYPDFMKPAAEAVSNGDCEAGIILGGSGQGEAMVANRVSGVRCTLFYSLAVARQAVDAQGKISHDPYEILRLSRQHNHANMLSFGARFLSVEEMKQAIKVWLDAPYSDEPRHARRVKKMN
jgi:ribose 5-phosphate isomerase B